MHRNTTRDAALGTGAAADSSRVLTATHDDPGESMSVTVLHTVMDATESALDELEPLTDVVDPDALDQLFREFTEGVVRFRYSGCDVAVSADGDVSVVVPEGE